MVEKTNGVARVGDVELAYETFGQKGQPAVVLIMGLGMQLLGWGEGLCEGLAQCGYRVVRFDNRDVGLSTSLDQHGVPLLVQSIQTRLAAKLPEASYTLTDMAGDVLALMDALEIDRAHVVGASMGGMIAQCMALEEPARVLSLTSIMSTTGDFDLPGPEPRAMGLMMMPPALHAAQHEKNVLHSWSILGGSAYSFREERLKTVAARSFARGLNPGGFARQMNAVLASPPRGEALKSSLVPGLVIHGSEDPLVPLSCGERTAACLPGARLEVIRGLGHVLPESFWPELIELLDGHCRQHTA